MLGNEGMIQRGRGLVDLIAGKTPTLSDWTVNPTDGADITDGDPATACTTGNLNGAAWETAHFEWDLGAFYNVLCGGYGKIDTDAGSTSIFVAFWDGSAWKRPYYSLTAGTSLPFNAIASGGSKVRLDCMSNAVSTITPNIREFHVWRL